VRYRAHLSYGVLIAPRVGHNQSLKFGPEAWLARPQALRSEMRCSRLRAGAPCALAGVVALATVVILFAALAPYRWVRRRTAARLRRRRVPALMRRRSARRMPRKRRGRQLGQSVRAVAATLLVLAVVFAAVTARLFVWPVTHQPASPDAVVVLSGDHGERLPRALDLIRRGTAGILVLNGTPDSLTVIRLCQEPHLFEVVCLRPRIDNTRTEAEAAGELAAARGWDTIVVVTSTQHVTRARLHFDRCVRARVLMVAGRPPYGLGTTLGQIRHEWLGVLHALITRRTC
jgi:hypothetical protein